MAESILTSAETRRFRAQDRKKPASSTERVSWSLALLVVPGVLYFLIFAAKG
ncbi:hypothetical protein [Phytoactinopolyspora endophytica]|uniref:hypothetical protein n=1 Tax=Phytoactinopolyspora endophytica TaxID=1642495 RepID=UPI0013ECA87B|nr:hypothetical protein [Phytoactinopolyspora endophytica]